MQRIELQFKLLFSIVFLLAVSEPIFGQLPVEDPKDEKPTGCDMIRTVLDTAILEAQRSPSNSFVIFIFRRGSGDDQKDLITNRLNTVKRHVEFRASDLSNIILAEGERHIGLGRVDIFIRGELRAVLYMSKNENLGSNCKDEGHGL